MSGSKKTGESAQVWMAKNLAEYGKQNARRKKDDRGFVVNDQASEASP